MQLTIKHDVEHMLVSGRDLYVSGERRAAIWRAESRNCVNIVKNIY